MGSNILFYQIIYQSLTIFYNLPSMSAHWFYWFVLSVWCFLFQAWRERYGLQGATGRTRSGYTELKDNQSSLVTEIKKNGN